MAEAASGHGELAVRIIAAGNAVECALVTGRFGGAGEAGLEYKLSQRLCSRMGGSLECTGGSGGGGSFTVVFRERRACRPRRRKRWSRRRPAGRGTTVFFSWMMFR